jgi:hypothetical protein
MLVTDVKCHEVTVLSGLWFTLFLSPETFFLVRTGSYFFFLKLGRDIVLQEVLTFRRSISHSCMSICKKLSQDSKVGSPSVFTGGHSLSL